MKKFFLVLLAAVVVLIVAAVAVPFLLPTEAYKQQIEAQVSRATGRALVIEGPLDISVLPTLAVTAERVRFANVEGSARPEMARLKALQAELKIWPLLRGAVEVDRFVLLEPEFNLEIDAAGRPNWALGPPEQTQTKTPEQAGAETGQPSGGMRLPITEVTLGDIRIENGTLTLSDARSGSEERLEAINLDLGLPDLRSPLAAKGSFSYKGKPVELALAAERPLALVQGGSSPVRVNGQTPDLTLTFAGAVDNAATPQAAGALELNVASIRNLAAWLAAPIAFEGEALKTFRVNGKLAGSPTRISLSDASLGLDAIQGHGEVVVDLSGRVPQVTGRLDLGPADLNPYLAPPTAGEGAATTGGAPAPRQGAAGTQATDWSDDPIELPPIGGADIDFALTTKALKVRDLQVDNSRLALRLQGQHLAVELQEIALYGGQGSGQLDLQLVDGTPQLRHQFRLQGLHALPFLTAAADFERLRGTASAEIALQTRGRTQREMVRNLSGQGQATFRDGAIVGINLAAMVRNAGAAFQGGATGEERETDFAELSGSFSINNGILTNDDLWLQAPVLRVTGRGQLDLPRRTVDYRVEPKAAPTLEGQSGEREVAGLLVPVIVRGPWDNLTFTPDLSAVARRALEDPEAFKQEVEQQVEQLGDAASDVRKALKKGDAEKLLEGVLGGQGGGQDQSGQAGQGADAARKLLKGLFGN